MYLGAESVVRHNNWLTDVFPFQRGVRQGCPLSCHLFNLVGQVLIYHLRDNDFFSWWTKAGDPCSLYTDDMAIFVKNIAQLSSILEEISFRKKLVRLGDLCSEF